MRLSKKKKAELHRALQSIKEDGNQLEFGICKELLHRNASLYLDAARWLERLWKKWPKFSGNPRFPIPSPDTGPPGSAFYQGVDEGTNWDKRTKYGRLRWELLDFLIEQTKPEA